MEWIAPYQITVLTLGATGLLIWLQLIVMDLAAIKAKHTPGFAIEQDHESFLFRASRAFGNTNETLGLLVIATLFAVFSSADSQWVNISALVYLGGRIGHMVFYYINFKLLRSTAFTVSFVALLSMMCAGIWAWF